MKNTFFLHLSTTFVPILIGSILLVSCSQRDIPSPTDVSTIPTPIEEFSETLVIPPPETTPSQPSYLVFDHISGDAGNFYLLAGTTITFSWKNPPEGANEFEFRFISQRGEPPVVVGNDVDTSDGVSITWAIPANIAGEIHATAFFSDGQTVDLPFPPMLYSGDFPPSDVCTLLARNQPVEVYRLPDRTSQIFALLSPGVFARVLEIASDGWYRIDASVAEEYSSPRGSSPENGFKDYAISRENKTYFSVASGEGWINEDKGIMLTGDCPSENRIIYYSFVNVEDTSYPEGSVVIMEDTYILAPTLSDLPFSNDIVSDLKLALLEALNDSRNGWKSSNLEIIDITFEDGHADVDLQGEYFGVGDITLIAARMQILLTVFANPAVQSATVTLNGDTIGNLGVSNSMWARPEDYVFPRSEIDDFITENAYQSP